MSSFEPIFTHPTETSVPTKNMTPDPQDGQPNQHDDSEEYLCGDTSPLQGINPGRDQDRSRIDECIPASWVYNSGSSGEDPIPSGFELIEGN